MAKIDNFSNEIQLSLNHIQSKIFEILGVDKQMVIISVQDEPNRSPKKSVFGSVIGVYLMSFFYEHPVFNFDMNHAYEKSFIKKIQENKV